MALKDYSDNEADKTLYPQMKAFIYSVACECGAEIPIRTNFELRTLLV